jgi:hypothetical protein
VVTTGTPPGRRRYVGAWIRYGLPITPEQIGFAARHYSVAILQPWETDTATTLKRLRPDMVVLAYKCLSSTRSYEPGPVFSSGVGFEEAEDFGEHLFAHRRDGTRIEWSTYPGHWQMAVWQPDYQQRWCANVVSEMRDSPWDGVMADNDVFDDYYGLRPPLAEVGDIGEIRHALDRLVGSAGRALNAADKILVPNIAESRREPGRWDRHSAYGGGFEEVWLAYGPENCFDAATVLAQADQARGPGVSIMRIATDGTNEHRNFTYGLAAFWIFGGGRGTGFAATGHDQYSDTPFIAQLDWDLGEADSPTRSDGGILSRSFTSGWAAININDDGATSVPVAVPDGLVDANGENAPPVLDLVPHHGAIFRTKGPRDTELDLTGAGRFSG